MRIFSEFFNIIHDENICYFRVLPEYLLHFHFCIATVYHDYLTVLIRQKRNKAVCIRVFQHQQHLVVFSRCCNFNLARIFREEQLITVRTFFSNILKIKWIGCKFSIVAVYANFFISPAKCCDLVLFYRNMGFTVGSSQKIIKYNLLLILFQRRSCSSI